MHTCLHAHAQERLDFEALEGPHLVVGFNGAPSMPTSVVVHLPFTINLQRCSMHVQFSKAEHRHR